MPNPSGSDLNMAEHREELFWFDNEGKAAKVNGLVAGREGRRGEAPRDPIS
jgi:hypothetical protein